MNSLIIGDRYAQLKPAQLDELVLYFLSLPFEEAKKYEMKRGFEAWTDTIDYKNIYLSISMNDPVFFSVVAKKLDRLINIRRWVCFPKGHLKFNTVCLRYDMPDDIESILNFK